MARPVRSLIPGLALLAALAVLVQHRRQPPAPLPTTAPPELYSGGRAGVVLARLLADEAPHETGSPAHQALRERLLAELRDLGLEPRVETRVACSPRGICALTRNVLAEIPGELPGPFLLLASHYDSRAAAPGAADAGACLAAMLEVARALRAGPPLRHPVRLLFDDAEELGLLGARAYLATPGRAAETHAVVNLEARGTAGASLVFETSTPSLPMARALAAGASHPVSTSLFATVYRFLPNDTDLTVFRAAGVPGLGLAFIGRPMQYHTREDRLANLDPASLQHHGQQALALLRALDRSKPGPRDQGDAVHFDLLATGVVVLPTTTALLVALANLVLWLGLLRALVRRAFASPATLAQAAGTWLGTLALAAALGFGLHLLQRSTGAVPGKWVASPAPTLLARWALGLTVALAVPGLALSRQGAWSLWSAWWGAGAALGLAAAASLPGMAYLLVLPSLAAGLATALELRRGRAAPEGPSVAAALVPVTAAGVLVLPLLGLLHDGLGFWIPCVHVLVAAWVGSSVAAQGGRAPVALLALGAALVPLGLLGAATRPPYTREHPRQLTFHLHRDAPRDRAEWLAVAEFGPLPAAVQAFAPFTTSGETSRELKARHPVHRAPARVAGLPPPEAEGAHFTPSAAGGVFRARLRSRRQAHQFGLVLPPDLPVTRVELAGQTLWEGPAGRDFPGLWPVIWVDPGAGAALEVHFHRAPDGDLRFWDETAGLPPEAAPLLAARPEAAATAHQGDRTRVFAAVPWRPGP